ncbi:MAG: thioredoxin family protein [SAR86 cluster bacterium]|jgi:thiol-disulfide isomerase/thioredoxin|nr:thioredoxin family protein [SAR86 cluster bacterium]
MNKFYISISLLLYLGGQYIMASDILNIPDHEVLVNPLPLPYERREIKETQVLDFINQSRIGNQSIIIFGANWCPDCRILQGTLSLPTVQSFIEDNFSLIHIDVGKYDINMNLLELLGIPRQEGIPRVVIFGEKDNILNLDSTDKWRSARQNKSQEIFEYFQSYVLRK